MKRLEKAKGRKGRKADHTTPRTPATTLYRSCPTCAGSGAVPDMHVLLLDDELQKIARDSKISPSHLSKILNNADPKKKKNDKRGLTLKTAIRLSKRMGLTLDELAGLLYSEHLHSTRTSRK